jgi:hypothetical protein
MADNKKDDKRPIRFNVINKMANRVQDNITSLYRSAYYSDSTNRQQLQALKTDISSSIKSIMDTSSDNIGEPNISRLYERLFLKSQDNPEVTKEFERIFGDNDFVNNLANSYLDNRWVRAVDSEIDEVLKYMPKLEEALQTIRDNVLSSDSFSKDYLNLESHFGISNDDTNQFSRNVEELKKKYDLLSFINELYYDISKYGEVFVYCVPYTKAIQKLMDDKNTNSKIALKTNYTEGAIITESVTGLSSTKIPEVGSARSLNDTYGGEVNVDVQLERGLISSIVQNEKFARDKKKQIKMTSLTEQYLHENGVIDDDGKILMEAKSFNINEAQTIDIRNDGKPYNYSNTFDHDLEMGEKLPVHHNFDHTLDDNLPLPNDSDPSSEGLVDSRKRNKRINEMNGCIIKKLKRESVTPIVLNDICLGYYYFEFDNNQGIFDERYTTTGMVNTITGLMNSNRDENFDMLQRREELLRTIASQLADKIDTEFINDNQDLKKEIYYILKYNDDFNNAAAMHTNIRVSYIPPEDIHHMYFKLDEDTGRGISDLKLSLIPAKLWVAIYITNCLAIMTRGNDKRVYYVRQSVETNISKTLLKTINEIKKSNFGIRQVENINSVLNVTGRFNDYIIPRGSDGQSPIEFEVMQGQQVEIKTELLNLLEESAINPTGVPIEIIQNRQSPDYAMQLTMSNSKFLRFVYGRQSDFENIISPFLTKVYDIEFLCSDRVEVVLPPPLFINVTNTNQLIVNTNDYCENVANIVMSDETNDAVKAKFIKKLKIYHLGSYIKMDVIENLANQAKQEVTKDMVSNPESIDTGE